MTTWDSNNKLIRDTELFEAIGKIRSESDKRRDAEARVLAENNLASVRQLSEDKKKQFCAIVDAILAEQADVNTQLFMDDQHLAEAASKIKVTPWTKQDNNPEKNSTFTGAPKTNPNKGGYAGGTKAEKTKHGYTAMRRIKEDTLEEAKKTVKEDTDLQELSKKTLGSYVKKAHKNAVDSIQDAEYHRRNSSDYADRLATAIRKKNKFGKQSAASMMKHHDDAADDLVNRANRRRRGIDRATDKLTKEDMDSLEEMYLDIENFVLESEGYDSIDRLNEQGQEKLAAIVENVMEEILAEEEEYDESLDEDSNLHELSPQLLRRAADKAHQKGNILSRTKGSRDPEARARWGQSIKMAHAAASKEAAATSKSIPSFRNLKSRLAAGEKIRPKYEETMEEGWFSGSGKKTPTPNPKGAPRGERDVGDYKNPTGHANKDVPQAVRNDRKLAKRNGGRLSGEGY